MPKKWVQTLQGSWEDVPMIFEAFSGSKFLILETTTFVAMNPSQTEPWKVVNKKWNSATVVKSVEEEETIEDDVFVVCYRIP